MGYLEQSNVPNDADTPKKAMSYSDVREMHRDILHNTFHPAEEPKLPELAPSLPPDVSMVLLTQTVHRAHARMRQPTLTQRLWRTITPSGRSDAAAAVPEARKNIILASDILATHPDRMAREEEAHDQEFRRRMRPDQSLIMSAMAHILHTDENEWKPYVDDVRAKLLEHVDAGPYEQRAILARMLSQLHVISHRASDQIRELCAKRELELPTQNIGILQRSASTLATACLRLQQWECVDPCSIKKNFVMDMRMFDGDWHR